jgi:hypothetical protein
MIILEKTKTQLKLRHRPYFIWRLTGSWMLGILLLLLLISLQYTWLIYLWWMPLFLLLNLVTCSLVFILAGQVITCHFDKEFNNLTIRRRGLLNTKIIWHSLTDILDIQLESRTWNPEDKASYQIIVVLRAKKSFPLNIGQGSDIKKNLVTVNLIRKFLDMPPQTLS